jgi:TPR repeat protein
MRLTIYPWLAVVILCSFTLIPASSFAGKSIGEVQQYEKIKLQALNGNLRSQVLLASYLEDGIGVERDEVEAVKWYRKAADQGYHPAQFALGVNYADGIGVVKDVAEAIRWYRKAADQGNEFAQTALGVRYTLGDGVPKDYVEAYAYLNIAGVTYADAKKRLASLERQMSQEAIFLGQRRTKELQKEIEVKIAEKKAAK